MTALNIGNIAAERGYSVDAVNAARRLINFKTRRTNPPGSFDKARRFRLEQRCDCCERVREPSRAYPFSELPHGRSAEHVAALHGVPPLHVKRIVKAIQLLDDVANAHDRMTALLEARAILKPV